MSLRISTWDTQTKDRPELPDGDWSFGFERYRLDLWGTEAVRAVGAEIIPRLSSQDLYLGHRDLDALEHEARMIGDASDAIAAEVFDLADPGNGVVVVEDGHGGRVHNAFGSGSPADSIHRYIDNLLYAIAFARQAGCGLVIW